MRDRLLKKHLRHRFLVTLKTGQTFDGLVDEWDGKHLVLTNAHVVAQDQSARTQPYPVDGRVWLDWAQIAYLQEPTAAMP